MNRSTFIKSGLAAIAGIFIFNKIIKPTISQGESLSQILDTKLGKFVDIKETNPDIISGIGIGVLRYKSSLESNWIYRSFDRAATFIDPNDKRILAFNTIEFIS